MRHGRSADCRAIDEKGWDVVLTEEHLVALPGLSSRWVRLATGAKAHYSTAGETGPSVILLHGALHGSSGHAAWSSMAPFLGANGFRVYCPDLPHFGLTENHDVYPAGFAGAVDFVHDFANALCLDQFNIGGNSNGACVAMSYTVNHPDRVLKMGLIASRGMLGLVDAEAMAHADPRPPEERAYPEFDGTEASMRKMMSKLVYFPDRISDDLVAMRTFAGNKNLDGYHKRGRGLDDPNYLARIDIRGRIQRLTIPGIYVCGQQDVTSTLAISHLQEEALTNFQVFYPEDTGHQGQTDQPELFNQLFLEFFRDGRVSRQTADRAGVSRRRPELDDVVEQA
jgi:pimeloyl-ACP methyl ester carboxylesterase